MKSRVIKIAALFTAVIMAACVFTACKKTPAHTHTFGTEWKYNDTQHWKECTDANCTEKSELANHTFAEKTGAKSWQVVTACSVCNYVQKTETDYTKMSLQQFFAEMLNNEGNYIVETEYYDLVHRVEVNGKNSCYKDTDNAGIDDYKYCVTTDKNAYKYNYDYDNEVWYLSYLDIDNHNAWLDWDGDIFTDEIIDKGWGIKANDFKAGDSANTYILNDGTKPIWGATEYSCEITFNKNNIVMKFIENGSTDTYTYTITLGNCAPIVLPDEVKALHDTVMMFGIAPDDFVADDYWAFYCDLAASYAIVDKILDKLRGLGYEISELLVSEGNWAGRGNIGVYVIDCGDYLLVEFSGGDFSNDSYAYTDLYKPAA